jgi:hypothetical protein
MAAHHGPMGPPTLAIMESPEICIDCTANINDNLGNYVGCECAQQRALELQQRESKLQQLTHWASLESAGCSIRELESVADKLADIEARCAWTVHHSTQLIFVSVRIRLNREVIKIIEKSCRRISFLQSQRSVRDFVHGLTIAELAVFTRTNDFHEAVEVIDTLDACIANLTE